VGGDEDRGHAEERPGAALGRHLPDALERHDDDAQADAPPDEPRRAVERVRHEALEGRDERVHLPDPPLAHLPEVLGRAEDPEPTAVAGDAVGREPERDPRRGGERHPRGSLEATGDEEVEERQREELGLDGTEAERETRGQVASLEREMDADRPDEERQARVLPGAEHLDEGLERDREENEELEVAALES